MRWILGLDLGPRSRGAVELARWLARTSPGDEFVAVHVLAADHLRAVLQYHHLDEVAGAATAAARAAVQGSWTGGAAPLVEVVQAVTAEDGLEAALARHGADGLLIGRAAASEGLHLVRLGGVARRLLRRLPGPVAIAPPDFTSETAGDGPVAALTTMTDDSVAACRAAADLATRAGRSLALAHVANDPRRDGGVHLARATLEAVAARSVQDARELLSAWVAATGLQPAVATVVQGDVLRSALSFVEEQRAPLVFVGARSLPPVDRAFTVSFGRDLAGSSPVPVVVVPPR